MDHFLLTDMGPGDAMGERMGRSDFHIERGDSSTKKAIRAERNYSKWMLRHGRHAGREKEGKA
jgi:hypothetical protein